MHEFRALAVLFLLTTLLDSPAVGSGQSPAISSTLCDRYQHSDLIFTGSSETTWITLVDTRKSPVHKRSEKAKRIRFLVREWFKGQRRNTVEVWITPADCPLSIHANATYLIYGRINKDKRRTETNGCMGTAPVENAAPDLTYLAAAVHGPSQATHISGTAGAPGVNIQAKSGIDTRYSLSDTAGNFSFDGLPAGDWDVSIVGGSPKPVKLAPGSCISVDLSH